MKPLFPLAPRYRLDDESIWLQGIDPSRHYWVAVNGDMAETVAIPGLTVSSQQEFKETLTRFRGLEPGEQMLMARIAGTCTIECITPNCYAIASEVKGAPVWHLFDAETLESLLMTSHPDWICAPKDVELGRQMLVRSWEQSLAA